MSIASWFKSLIAGLLFSGLAQLQGAGPWAEDPYGLVAAGLVPALPLPHLAPSESLGAAATSAVSAHAAGKLDEATRRMVRGVLTDPDDRDLRMALGALLLVTGENEQAAMQFERVLAQDPTDAVALYQASDALSGTIRAGEGIELIRRAVRQFPGWAEAHSREGLVLIEDGQEEAGLAALGRALNCSSVSADVYYEVGNLYLNREAPGEAVRYLEEALRLRPSFSFAANNLGNAYKALKKPEQAMAAYKKAIAADPKNPNPRNALGVLLEEKGEPSAALEAYQAAIDANPHYFEAHYNMGLVLLKQGKARDAAAEFLLASRLNPGFAMAYFKLGEAFVSLGQFDRARASYRRATALDPALLKSMEEMPAWLNPTPR